MKHLETHPEFVEGCFACKVSTIAYNGCFPTRSKGAGRSDATLQKKWDKELQAYRDARAQGVQPAGTSKAKVESAMKASEKAGKAFDATTRTFKD